MWFFPMMFWFAVIFFFMHASRRRRWRRWAMMQEGAFGPYGLYLAHERGLERGLARRGLTPPQRREPDDPALVEQLESRIAELEQRLDFTERLLAERRG